MRGPVYPPTYVTVTVSMRQLYQLPRAKAGQHVRRSRCVHRLILRVTLSSADLRKQFPGGLRAVGFVDSTQFRLVQESCAVACLQFSHT